MSPKRPQSSPNLFAAAGMEQDAPRPLPDRLRPQKLSDVVGQDHILGPDGRLLAVQTQAAGAADSRVQVLDLDSGTVLHTYAVPYGTGGLAFSPDGRELAALGCCSPGSRIEV